MTDDLWGAMIFVEIFRVLLVFAGITTGLAVGDRTGASSGGALGGVLIGAGVTYVAGGILGRFLDREMKGAVSSLRTRPAMEIFAGSVVGTMGLLLGLVLGVPVFAFVHSNVDYPLVAMVAWALCVFGVRLGTLKGRDFGRAIGLSSLLDVPGDRVSDGAIVVDTSALLHRSLLALGRSGLLGGGIVVPRFVVDEARTLAESPDPVSSRRARRGLESLEVLKDCGVDIRISDEELPGIDHNDEKALAVAHRRSLRLATTSSGLVERARMLDVAVLDLAQLPHWLSPDHPPGERMAIDLVKVGRQPRQAVGYLPDGDMVVVNDAAHLVGSAEVEVEVVSTRQTSQGLLVFAHLATEPSSGPSATSDLPVSEILSDR